MIVSAKMDAVDVLGTALTAGAPVATADVDFAAMMASIAVQPEAFAISQPLPPAVDSPAEIAAAPPAEDRPATDREDVAPEAVLTLTRGDPSMIEVVTVAVAMPERNHSLGHKTKQADQINAVAVERPDVRVVSAAPVMVETVTPRLVATTDPTEPVVVIASDQRLTVPMPMPVADKQIAPPLDRGAAFPLLVADAVRDVLTIAMSKDVRFNVRPDTLGPVAVTIERGDAGPSLHLRVDTPAAVQAIRQAEPMLNDARGNTPFVQVSVDLGTPEGRGRPARAAFPLKRGHDEITDNILARAAVTTGRYA